MSLYYGNYDSKNERKQHNCHNDYAILTEIIVFNPFNSDIIVKLWSGARAPLQSFYNCVLIDISAIIALLIHLFHLKHIISYYIVLYQVIL